MTETYDGDGWRCEWEWRNDGAGPGIASQSYREPVEALVTDRAEFVDAYGDAELEKFLADPLGWASDVLQGFPDEPRDDFDDWTALDYRRCGFDD